MIVTISILASANLALALQGQAAPNLIGFIGPMILIMVVFYFFYDPAGAAAPEESERDAGESEKRG